MFNTNKGVGGGGVYDGEPTTTQSTLSLKMLLENLTTRHICDLSTGGFSRWRQYFSKIFRATPIFLIPSKNYKSRTLDINKDFV